MFDRINKTLICSVVFLDIVEYSRQPVSNQILLKDAFNRLLSDALQDIAVNDRIIIDTGDGAAICFLGDPEDALFVAISLRDAMHNPDSADPTEPAKLAVRIGINLGPAKVVRDINGQPNLLGDGINAAERIMSFAQPGYILVSRSFFEVVSCLSDEYAQLLQYDGSRTDKHVREHEVYQVGFGEIASRLTHPVAGRKARPGSPSHTRRLVGRRQLALGGLFAIVMAGGVYFFNQPAMPSSNGTPDKPNAPPEISNNKTIAYPSQPTPSIDQPSTNAAKNKPPVAAATTSPITAVDTHDEKATAPAVLAAKPTAAKPRKVAKLGAVKAEVTQAPAAHPKACPPSECWPNGRPKRDR